MEDRFYNVGGQLKQLRIVPTSSCCACIKRKASNCSVTSSLNLNLYFHTRDTRSREPAHRTVRVRQTHCSMCAIDDEVPRPPCACRAHVTARVTTQMPTLPRANPRGYPRMVPDAADAAFHENPASCWRTSTARRMDGGHGCRGSATKPTSRSAGFEAGAGRRLAANEKYTLPSELSDQITRERTVASQSAGLASENGRDRDRAFPLQGWRCSAQYREAPSFRVGARVVSQRSLS